MPDDPRSTVRRRTVHACMQCRRHKIKCSGAQPCERCERRQLPCVFGAKKHYSSSYVRDLQRRVAAAEQALHSRSLSPPTTAAANTLLPDVVVDADGNIAASDRSPPLGSSVPISGNATPPKSSGNVSGNEEKDQINVLAIGQPVFVPDDHGRVFYLGTSSNWSFGRRVLLVAHESTSDSSLNAEELLFPGKTYNLGWNGDREHLPNFEPSLLPEFDFATYLVSAVKFYAGQLFHLFDEDTFMDNFRRFHEKGSPLPTAQSLWFKHYLLILAFGKGFVTRANRNDRPAGYDFFTQAMATLPDFTFSDIDPLEGIEILCCAALYLQCLDHRPAAYRLIGDALRLALDQGLHTDMHHRHMPENKLQRCRRIWWTVHLLDRQLSSQEGLPFAMQDENISSDLPSFNGSDQKIAVLDIHIKLSKVMAMTASTVYGKEGRTRTRFLVHTKAALKAIAQITSELEQPSMQLSTDRSDVGISRVAAYLHLLQHECIIIATRPILFNFFKACMARAGDEEDRPRKLSLTDNVAALLQMCKDSALQALRILRTLKSQGLLETFLPFDLNAAYTSTIVVLMAHNIDVPLLEDYTVWMKMAWDIFDEMEARGNRIAQALKFELKKLEQILIRRAEIIRDGFLHHPNADSTNYDSDTLRTNSGVDTIDWNNDLSLWQDHMNAEQLLEVADSIDLDGMEWWFSTETDD